MTNIMVQFQLKSKLSGDGILMHCIVQLWYYTTTIQKCKKKFVNIGENNLSNTKYIYKFEHT